ncbi:VWA domain-containing protein [Candidatus Halobonum tyrrellensis]|uniref:Mg-chelatase subunit chld n=1 Tax=Candidatus Halobonum tyrrellensis G22 TaxID=1324957 RepID=V4J0Z6_9EURY|nr:VWA domain-containing protein [Candidatus Halobonum tyrrellensis]ESP89132.1 mg-chelatase subunit chld [Candidatus Halobonum tyrrellensis G22]
MPAPPLSSPAAALASALRRLPLPQFGGFDGLGGLGGLAGPRSVVVDGVTVGLSRPLLLLALPLGLLAVWAVVYRNADGTAGRRSRRLLAVSRVVVVCCLVVAAAGPYTAQRMETTGDPSVTMLVDDSDSMAVLPDAADGLAERVEAEGVPVTRATIAQGARSPLGDGVAANLRENGTVVVVSDGRVTDGRSLADAGELAASLNATVASVGLEPTRTERYVTLSGPSKTSAGVDNAFLARVDGVALSGDARLVVEVDGETVVDRSLSEGSGRVEFSHAFAETGSHRVTARVESDDAFGDNDAFHRTVRVVDRPRVLYVSRRDYPFGRYLEDLYEVERAESVPANLSDSDYYAVVVQDVAADDLGDIDALQEFVIDGGGLLTVGGPNSFEHGNYESSSVASMLPVTVGESVGGSTNLVLAIDVSGSAETGMRVQKAVSLDALDQLGDDNAVGVVGFNHDAYAVAELAPLSENRGTVADRIRRLRSGGGTDIAAGLLGAEEMLGDERGSIILVSDGRGPVGPATAAAQRLGQRGIRVVAVGTGNPNEETLRRIAEASGGSYFRATDTDRLRLLFGGSSRQYEGEGLTVVDENSFVTAGVELTSDPPLTNDVSVRTGAEFLVASGEGRPAVASWRYGLGRVATITAYDESGTLDGLLSPPDSLLLTKSTNYVIGDPERKATGVAEAADTRVGEPTTVTYRGSEPPAAENVSLRQVGEDTYRATVTPTEAGYASVFGATYAANYPAEYAAFGRAPALTDLVRATGGETFDTGQAAEIAAFAREQSTRVRDVERTWDWAFLLAGLLVYLFEVCARRISVYTGRASNDGGLP